MHRPRHVTLSGHTRIRTLLLLSIALALLAPPGAHSQTPIRRIFGVGDAEFFKGAWMKIRPDSAGVDSATMNGHWQQIWQLADSLGIDILRIQGHDFDNFDITSAMVSQRTDWVRPRQRLILSNVHKRIGGTWFDYFYQASVGREIRFYPFTGRDSVEYKFWPAKFVTLTGGITDTNTVENDVYGNHAWEQQYRQASTSANTVIARDIAFDYYPTQQYRWPIEASGFVHRADSVQNAEEFLIPAWNFNASATNQIVVVTGHLFPNDTSTVLSTADILKIEVIYEIPKGSAYVSNAATTPPTVVDSATSDIQRNLATLYVRKSDLYPTGTGTLNWNAYREVALPFDARWCSDYTSGVLNTGPLYPGNESRRINLKVTWIGNEDLAIRSIALRDSIGQLVLGTSGADTAGQASLLDSALHYARRAASLTENGAGPAVWPVIACSPVVETHPMQTAAFNRITRIVHDSIPAFDSANNATGHIPSWDETAYNESLFQRHNEAANPSLLVPDAVVPEIEIKTFQWLDTRLHLRHGKIPSIAFHNGGRFQNPVLTIDTSQTGRDDIEYGYESTLQLLGFKQNIPYRGDPDIENRIHLSVGRAAGVARDTRRRMIIVPFCVARMRINYNDDSSRPERGVHSIAHIPEPAEMRTMVNMGLCYGAKGVLWQVIDGHYAIIPAGSTATDGSGTYWHGTFDDFGVHAPLARARNWDRFPSFSFYESVGKYGYESTTPRATITDFFTGWNIRSRALTDIHQWIDKVGPELMKLDWREGYSMHFTVEQPFDHTLPYRALSGYEIVRGISTRKPGSAVSDSAHRTFVELGLFYKKNATSDPVNDTNHIFIVNRRCFERTDDIEATSDTGKLMDQLAETREVSITFNMKHPVEGNDTLRQYDFIRVREIAADLTPLPGMKGERTPLDTVVYASNAVKLVLGPGRAALLRITYVPPETSINAGDLRYNSQRKLVFCGRRYHCVYWRRDTTTPYVHNIVYYRRSYPMTDLTGPIYWQPEIAISDPIWNGNVPSDIPDTLRVNNVFPSLTFRTLGGDTVITAVWTCHHSATQREVVLRNLYSHPDDSGWVAPGPLESLALHNGVDSTIWGTPVITTSNNGDFIAYSDSSAGVCVQYRLAHTSGNWWRFRDSVHSFRQNYSGIGYPSRYPSLPAFSNHAATIDNCGLVFEQPSNQPGNWINYRRISRNANPAFLPVLLYSLELAGFGNYSRPSIDAANMSYGSIERVAWQYVDTKFPGNYTDQTGSLGLSTPVIAGALPTLTRKLTGYRIVLDTRATLPTPGELTTVPSVAAYNWDQIIYGGNPYQIADFSVRTQFLVGTHNILLEKRREDFVGYTVVSNSYSFDTTFHTYNLSGSYYQSIYPQGSAAQSPQPTRSAMLYQAFNPITSDQSLLRTSRQFFARARPTGYLATGREIVFKLGGSMAAVVTATLHDAWVAGDDHSTILRFLQRDSLTAFPDSLSQAARLFRTQTFHAYDSTLIGFELSGRFDGDTMFYDSARFDCVAELVDSATGLSIQTLDSFTIASPLDSYHHLYRNTVDLLSGTYYLRLRLVTYNFTPDVDSSSCRYPVGDVFGIVDSSAFGKLRRFSAVTGPAIRMTALPNPFGGNTEITFTVPVSNYVSMTLHDQQGRPVATPVERSYVEAGRYAINLDGASLAPGTYIVQLTIGTEQTILKLVVLH